MDPPRFLIGNSEELCFEITHPVAPSSVRSVKNEWNYFNSNSKKKHECPEKNKLLSGIKSNGKSRASSRLDDFWILLSYSSVEVSL